MPRGTTLLGKTEDRGLRTEDASGTGLDVDEASGILTIANGVLSP
jgi:hypothetical protein